MFKKYFNKIGPAVIAVSIVLGLVMIRAQSAEDKKHIAYSGAQNSNVAYVIGLEGAWEPKLPSGVTMYHAKDPKIPLSGRFNIYDMKTGIPFFYVHPLMPVFPFMGDRYACWNLQVDDTKGGWIPFKVAGNMGLLGNEQDGWWTDYYNPTNTVYHIQRGTTTPTPGIFCELETRLMHDTVKFRWRIKNTSNVNRYAGMKLLLDVTTADVGDGWGYIFSPGYNFFESDTILKGNDIPEAIEIFDNPQNPVVSERFMLKGNGATPPDIVGIDDWDFTCTDLFSYFGSPTNPLFLYEPPPFFPLGDQSLAILWKPRLIPAGRSIDIVSYIGVGKSTALFNKPTLDNPQYVPAVEGPRALAYGSVIDGPTNPPFDVIAYFDNQDKYMSMTGGTGSLLLPDGLELDPSESEGLTKSFGTVTPGSEGKTSWKVHPTGNPTGILEYSVSLNANPVGGTIVKRTINVPATPTQRMASGWQMISMPFDTAAITDNPPPPVPGSAPNGLEALGFPGEYGIDYKIFEYDSKANIYITPSKFVPGTGYWLWSKNANVSTSQVTERWTYTPQTWNSSTFQQFELRRGWNLIGNPFVYTVTLGECYFYHPNFGTLNYEQAVAAGLISKTLYTYDTIYARYRTFSDRTVQIKPWNGYWIKALQTQVTVLISPASQIGANLGGGFFTNAALETKSGSDLNQNTPAARGGSGTAGTKDGRRSRR